jgi:flagellum-specific peptidoglycan hydrolase FlgJ
MILSEIHSKLRNVTPYSFISNHTYKILALSCIAYILITPNLSLGTFFQHNSTETQARPVQFAVTEQEGIDNVAPIKPKSVSYIKREQPVEKKKMEFQNLSFVLNSRLAKSGEVPKSIVAEKMANCRRYISQYAIIAKNEMRSTGVPASVTLAQGLLESDAGCSRLAQSTNNHFGIKCMSQKCKKGHCKNFSDDSHKDFFRTFQSPSESYKAHSAFLGQSRYLHLKKYATTDCTAWANGLQKAGYATDKKYAQKLLLVIDAFDLCRYDRK